MLDLDKPYICPYCGSESRLRDYTLKFKDNSLTWATCKICSNVMKRQTLFFISDGVLTSFEWGQWIYLSIRVYKGVAVNKTTYSFYDKIRWSVLKANLYLHGIYYERGFWNGFKNAKENYPQNKSLLFDLEAKITGIKGKDNKLDKYI